MLVLMVWGIEALLLKSMIPASSRRSYAVSEFFGTTGRTEISISRVFAGFIRSEKRKDLRA
ncbi:hypothetical protein [Roseateles violae]|uniref:Uncharacterized protein n=1 Tax=Roseateles violae TaxID=3058042 RepID=A0ABT8DN24_9BURK|nr:hypothetical protein [Pelomonas sp. PFR6]MDN3919780.1 hypothetical protein [Pelomonas sp. PFR6]